MKKLLVLFAFIGFVTQIQAQKIQDKDVPAVVQASFSSGYPTVKNASWSKEGYDYNASFNENKFDVIVTYSPSGNKLKTQTEIDELMLPKSSTDYVTKHYPTEKIRKAFKIIDATGRVSYKIGINGWDLFFDSNGSFILGSAT